MIAGREVALATLTLGDVGPPELVEAAAGAGFDAVTLRVTDGSPEPGPLAADTPVRRETLRRLRDTGLGVLDAEVIRLRRDTDPAALRPPLESAALLGARHVLAVASEPDDGALAERFAGLCDEAAALGMRAVLEFMAFSGCRTLADADAIVTRAAHPAGGLLVDPLHLRRSGGTPAQVALLAAAHPERFPYAQLCDAPAAAPAGGGDDLYDEALRRRLHPGEGGLPLADLLAALPARIPLSVEVPVAALRALPPAERAERAFGAVRGLLSPS